MKKAGNDTIISHHLQLPLAFKSADPCNRQAKALPAAPDPDDLTAEKKPDEARFQHDTLLQINKMIESISELLENVHIRNEVRIMAMAELQQISHAIGIDGTGSPVSKQG